MSPKLFGLWPPAPPSSTWQGQRTPPGLFECPRAPSGIDHGGKDQAASFWGHFILDGYLVLVAICLPKHPSPSVTKGLEFPTGRANQTLAFKDQLESQLAWHSISTCRNPWVWKAGCLPEWGQGLLSSYQGWAHWGFIIFSDLPRSLNWLITECLHPWVQKGPRLRPSTPTPVVPIL